MKKIIIGAAVVFTTSILSLYIKVDNVHPAAVSIQQTFFNYQKELANGD
jgi:hypothetical protein